MDWRMWAGSRCRSWDVESFVRLVLSSGRMKLGTGAMENEVSLFAWASGEGFCSAANLMAAGKVCLISERNEPTVFVVLGFEPSC